MIGEVDIAYIPVLQCCLLCHRMITDREQHNSYEDCVRALVRKENPHWVSKAASQQDSTVAVHSAPTNECGKRSEYNQRLRAIKIQRRRAQRAKLFKRVGVSASAWPSSAVRT